MREYSVSEARAKLPDLLWFVEDGGEVTITRHGKPIAVVINPSALRHRRAEVAMDNAARVHELLAGARATALPEADSLTEDRAEALIAEIRAGREAR
jgi:prevent-host-death family protein